MVYQLYYFNCRGRAQCVRYLCQENNIPYEEVDVMKDGNVEVWLKDFKPKLPFGVAPLLKEGDFEVGQTNAILRYLARTCGLHPENPKDAIRADMLCEVLEEVFTAYGTMIYTCYETGQEDHVTKAKEKFQYIEDMMKKWGDDYIFKKICFADYKLFDMLDIHDILRPGFVAQFPTLKAYYDRMAARPAIKAFRESALNTGRKICGNGKQ